MAAPGGIVPLDVGLPPVVPPQVSYRDYYQDDGHDSAMGNYTAMMNIFAVPGAGPVLTPQQVSEAVYGSAVVDPQAFLMLIVNDASPDGQILLFHRLQRYAPNLGNPTAYDNNGYAFFGDIVHGQAPPSVEWPANAFHQVAAAVRVPLREAIDQMLAANPEAALVGPFGNEDAGTEIVRVRQSILVPYRYVRLFLQRPLTPREAWIQVAGAIFNDNNQVACCALVDWLRVALTRQGEEQASRLQQPHPVIPLMVPALVQRRWNLVLQDLPGLSGGATIMAGNAIASSLNAFVNDNREFRQAEEERRELEKAHTPEKCFGTMGALKLIRLCQVATSDALPELWLNLARETRRQDSIVSIQQSFDSTAQTLGLLGVQIPITPDLVTKIKTIALNMSDEEDLTTGIHPFTFAYLESSEIAAAYARAEQYKMVQSDQGTPSLNDALQLSTPGKVKFPKSISEAHIYLQNFRVALHALLGANHEVTKAYDDFWKRWSTSQQYLLGVRTHQPGLFPSLAVRWVQLNISLWFGEQAATNTPVPAPDFVELLVNIRRRKPWEPTFPAIYYSTTPAASINAVNQATATFPGITVSAVAATPPTPSLLLESGQPTIRNRGLLQRKTTPVNPRFQRFIDMNLRVRDVLTRAGNSNRVPGNSEGTEMCLSYHLKGVCNSNCARNQDHKEHAAAEDQAILHWCETFYKPAE